jgi:phage baseplate assembly protein W
MDRRSGRLLVGFPHVQQSMRVAFATRFHERVLRYWVGSFVPHLLGRNIVPSTITRFFWAIATTLELFEPGYRIARVYVGRLEADGTITTVSPDQIRQGDIAFQTEGTYRPRGHLGDNTPDDKRTAGVIGRRSGEWGPL